MLIPFGILSAAVAEDVGETYELITSTILTSTASSITFSDLGNYASDYKHLQLRVVARSNEGILSPELLMRFNGDTGSNYARHSLAGNGSAAQSAGTASTSSIRLGFIAGSTATANVFAVSITDILDSYSTTKNKTSRTLVGTMNQAGAGRNLGLHSGFRNNTDSLTSLELFVATASFIVGSRFSLYGIRG